MKHDRIYIILFFFCIAFSLEMDMRIKHILNITIYIYSNSIIIINFTVCIKFKSTKHVPRMMIIPIKWKIILKMHQQQNKLYSSTMIILKIYQNQNQLILSHMIHWKIQIKIWKLNEKNLYNTSITHYFHNG